MGTRTGEFPIGFRRGWSEWQKDLGALARWAKESGFDAVDLGRVTAEDVQTLKNAGLSLGSGDLIETGGLLDNDPGKRREAIEKATAYVREAAAVGTKAFFLCIIPDPALKRSESYARAVESYTPVAAAAAAVGASLAIEGYPGGSPHMPSLCCTPETCRRFIQDVGAGVGLNYDPSHLIRLGVDHIRFLKEFMPYVRHVHAKDTEIDSEAVYEYGLYQPSPFAKPHGFGELVWRYTLPGHGCARWTQIFSLLKSNGYAGIVSIELEDENFNGSEAGEKSALLHSLDFLRGA